MRIRVIAAALAAVLGMSGAAEAGPTLDAGSLA